MVPVQALIGEVVLLKRSFVWAGAGMADFSFEGDGPGVVNAAV